MDFDLIFYVLLAVVTYWVYTTEKKDLALKNTEDILRSASWQDARPDSTDTVPDIIGKMHHLLRVGSRHVVWRRSFLSAVVASVLIWVVVMRKKPSWIDLLLTIGVTGVVFYHFWTHYTYHDFVETERTLENQLLQLDRRLYNGSKN